MREKKRGSSICCGREREEGEGRMVNVKRRENEESIDNWDYFFRSLRLTLTTTYMDDWTFISDRMKVLHLPLIS